MAGSVNLFYVLRTSLKPEVVRKLREETKYDE
jgi:hypothetical protein